VDHRRLRTVLVLATVVALVIVAWPTAELAAEAPAPRMYDKALAAIKADAFAGDRFTFCVIGDTQPPGRAVFLESIKEMNLLAPAFIIDVGDMISYPGGSVEAIHSRWDEFLSLCAALRVPFFTVVGNHDVGDWRSRGIYRERMAPLAYSFSYGNAHFICLDTEEPGYSDKNHERIGPAQLRWLKEDLEANKDASHVFVFMHKPIWDRGASDRWLTEVHPLLMGYPLAAVFTGHWHYYRKSTVDGIPYFITGGGGGQLHDDPKVGYHCPEGAFHHFMHVSVKGDQIHFAVVKTGNIESEDVVTGKVIETAR